MTVAGLGELLWDLFPGKRTLGGAPSNFAYNISCLGNQGLVVSAVGDDLLGREALQQLSRMGFQTGYIQTVGTHPTGTVHVELDPNGLPAFEIVENVAWDRMEWTPQLEDLASRVTAVSFGSLAQRSAGSRAAIRRFLKATRPEAVRVFDVNLRPPWYSDEVLLTSFALADIVKLNTQEMAEVSQLLGSPGGSLLSKGRRLLETFQLDLVCVTLGGEGCLLIGPNDECQHPGFRVDVADTVGSGDAFLAGMLHFYLRGAPLSQVAEAGNRMGAWVATQQGGMSSRTAQQARHIADLVHGH